jgi:glutamyl-tRNA synthetase
LSRFPGGKPHALFLNALWLAYPRACMLRELAGIELETRIMAPSIVPVTRFAPSPTGYLHIGGARTALFNWLFARHHGGLFRLRIEDTDRVRSTEGAIAAIFESMTWLGLDWDGEAVFQFARAARHREVGEQLLAKGLAYRCYASAEELTAMREAAKAAGRPPRYDGRWRDRDPADAPKGVLPAIRLKAPREGETIVKDLVQGDVRFSNDQLDDMVILRSDGTPTYMLAVVVDDFDMGVTHIVRGDDHLTNAARQMQLIQAMGWPLPAYAHVPLIHGPDGAKLSKRHGALSADAYRDMGYLPEAMRNYLLRLGWSHGDDEIIPTEKAIAWFNLEAIGRSPARFDFTKLDSINGHYIRESGDARLVGLLEDFMRAPFAPEMREKVLGLMPALKERAKTLKELADQLSFLSATRPIALDEKAAALLTPEARRILGALAPALEKAEPWTTANLEALLRDFVGKSGLKLGQAAQPLRAALTGRAVSPPVFDVMVALGRGEALARVVDYANLSPPQK